MSCLASVRLLVVVIPSANASGPHAVSVAWHYLHLALIDLIPLSTLFFSTRKRSRSKSTLDCRFYPPNM